jgi:UDP-N-acetyl-D-mannosaminuronic acid dehydrogenase
MSCAESLVVLGCGAIGLPLAVAFACRGHVVEGIDIDSERIGRLEAGKVETTERELEEALHAQRTRGRVRFASALTPSEFPRVYVMAVPTPVDTAHRWIRKCFDEAFESIAACAKQNDLLIVRSTVPIGTSRRLAMAAADRALILRVAACPDRSLAGQCFRDQFSVPTIVGGVTPEAGQAAADVFKVLGSVYQVNSSESAEALKLFSNVQRDITFAISNYFATLCEELNLDLGHIIEVGSRSYPRFYLARPGPVGGPCLSKDTYLLAESVGRYEETGLAMTARTVNVSLLNYAIGLSRNYVQQIGAASAVLVVLGLAFKGEPPTQDQRESFGIKLAESLRHELPHVELRAWDPLSADNTRECLRCVIAGAAVIVLANDHPYLRALDLREAASLMRRGGLILDMCAVPRHVEDLPNDVAFHSFGKGSA